MTPYVVRTGDHLAVIAHRNNVDPDVVWNHPSNAALKKQRGNPNILCSGDVLYLPDSPPKKWLPVSVGGTNQFAGTIPTVSLSLAFARNGKPIAGESCIVHGLPPPNERTTDGSGKLALTVPVTLQVLTVEFPKIPLVRRVRIGHLDPVTEASGAIQRLRSLGYLAPRTALDLSDSAAVSRVVTAFQKDQGVALTGLLDDDTMTALEKAHGC